MACAETIIEAYFVSGLDLDMTLDYGGLAYRYSLKHMGSLLQQLNEDFEDAAPKLEIPKVFLN